VTAGHVWLESVSPTLLPLLFQSNRSVDVAIQGTHS
jgi:hypothetical protein